MNKDNTIIDNRIAIIGMSGKFPGAKDINEYWHNIVNKVESISYFSEEELQQSGEVAPCLIKNKNYVKAKGHLNNASLFDAKFFDFSQNDAEILDPQFRLFLETCWEAMENAAYIPGEPSHRVGVFAGSSSFDSYYQQLVNSNSIESLSPASKLSMLTYNAKDFLASLVGYKLNLTGPCVSVQTACSTSLVAICLACESLLNNKCDLAIAGGVSITVPLKSGYIYAPGMIMSPNGHCKPFDENADGTVIGNGVGAIVLKRYSQALADNDHIHAIIRGFAVNNDGNSKVGFTAPSLEGQKKAIIDAMETAQVSPCDISYIEAHGSGTQLGDAIEIEALKSAYAELDKGLPVNSVAIGSVKANIGHLDVAAGIAGVIKATEALKNRILPPSINFNKPNIETNITHSNFFVNQDCLPWAEKNCTRIAAVSSFGMGGTNAHLILEQGKPRTTPNQTNYPVLLVLSAKNLSALIRLRRSLSTFLATKNDIDFSSVAFTLQTGRKSFEKRFACMCLSIDDAVEKLSRLSELDILTLDIHSLDNRNRDVYEKTHRLAKSWLSGQSPNWNQLYATGLRRIPLPTYPFERREYWKQTINHSSDTGISSVTQSMTILPFDILESNISNIFKSFLGMENVTSNDDFFYFGGDSLLSLQVVAEIHNQLKIKISAKELIDNPSPHRLANYINEKMNANNNLSV